MPYHEINQNVTANVNAAVSAENGEMFVGKVQLVNGENVLMCDRELDPYEAAGLRENGVRIINVSKNEPEREQISQNDLALEAGAHFYRLISEVPEPKIYSRTQKAEAMSKAKDLMSEKASLGDDRISFGDVPMFSDDELSGLREDSLNGREIYVKGEEVTEPEILAAMNERVKKGTLEVRDSSLKMRRDELQRELDDGMHRWIRSYKVDGTKRTHDVHEFMEAKRAFREKSANVM